MPLARHGVVSLIAVVKHYPPKISSVVGSFGLLAFLPSHAAPAAEESFLTGGGDYALGALVGQNVASTGFTGAWLPAFGGAGSPDVISTGLTYSDGTNDMVVGGGAIDYSADGRVGRLLAQPYTNATTGAVYFSVLIKVNSSLPDYRGFELHQGGFDDNSNRVLQIVTGEPGVGLTDSSYVLRMFNNGALVVDLGESDTEANLFVGRIDFSADPSSDAITIWRNPEDLQDEGGSTIDGTLTGFDLRIDRASFARFGGADSLQFDEVRFGTAWTDVTTVVDPADTDNDGMLDSYETANGLTVGIDDSLEDLDMDGSINLEEFTRNTRANVADTDGDGIRDGSEDGGGVFESGMKTGTDPLVFDTDGDGLRDGYEDGSGEFTDETMTGTDPNKADSDGDEEDDGVEVREGTDPNSAADSSASRGLVIVDGQKDALYPEVVAVQTIETGFGDNQSEWNAAYAYVNDGFLHLLLTGNLEANFNKLEIFVDSVAGGQPTFAGVTGNDGSEGMNGMTFDSGFEPDFHLIARRGSGKFDLNIADLNEGTFDEYFEVLKSDGVTVDEGIGETGVGQVNATPIKVGYDHSNLAGIGGNAGDAANQDAALAVMTGLELKIALSDLGSPGGEIRIMTLQNNSGHDFLANQSLGGLPLGTGNLGAPGGIDFGTFDGDQFFTVVVGPGNPPQIEDVEVNVAAREFVIRVVDLVVGQTYHVESSDNLNDWDPLAGAEFVAPGTQLQLTIGADYETQFKQFYRVVEGPAE